MDINIISQVITSITSIVAIIFSIVALRLESKRSRVSQEIQIMSDLSNKFFHSEDFIRKRRGVAKLMSDLAEINDSNAKSAIVSNHVDRSEIFDFFQHVGFLSKKKLISVEYASKEFMWWFINYWEFFSEYTAQEQLLERALWEDLPWLYDKFGSTPYYRRRSFDSKEFIDFELANES
jgi:hypothetical protein